MRNNSPQDDPLTPTAPTEGELTDDPSSRGAKGSTPAGQRGAEDLRESLEEHGKGKVSDAAGVKTIDSEHHFAPSARLLSDPSSDDPYSTPEESERVREMQRKDPTGQGYPSYEVGRCPDDKTGGSTDPNNSLTHADSGNESIPAEDQ